MVKIFQIHRYSKTCRKYRHQKCRFYFGEFFSDRAIAAGPLPDDMTEQIKNQVFKNSKGLLRIVKSYINTELNPSKKNFLVLQELIMKE